MALILSLQPQINNYYVPGHGPQGNLRWGFYDDSLTLVTPTQASFEVTIDDGAAAGTIQLDGVSFLIDAALDVIPGYTTSSFLVSPVNALTTAGRLRNAIRANQTTTGRWQITITGDATTAILTAVAVDLGTQIRASSTNTTPYSRVVTAATEGLLKDRLFLAYQGVIVYEDGLEDPITPVISLPPGFDYGATADNFIPLYVDLQEAVRKYLSTPFPAEGSNVPSMVHSAAALVYLRYGSLEYLGCNLVGQDFIISTAVPVINQAMGFDEKVGPAEFTPTSTATQARRTFSLAAQIGQPLTRRQHAWVYFYANVRFISANPALMPAYQFEYYDSNDSLISTSTVQLINWPTTSGYNKSVVSVPVGMINHGASGMPSGSQVVICKFGVSTGAILTELYERYTYRLQNTDCQDYEICFLGSLGSWESIVFEEEEEMSLEINQTTVRLAQRSRIWTSDLNETEEHSNYLYRAGDTQRNTTGRKRLKLKTLNLDNSEGSRRFFEAFLTSEDRRLILYTTTIISTEYLSAVRVNVIHASNKLVLDRAGKAHYQVEIEFAEDLPNIKIT